MTTTSHPQAFALQEFCKLELETYRRFAAKRDQLVIRALAAGLSKTQIAAASGLARTTVDRIAKTAGS